MRLDKFLSHNGYGTRKDVKLLLKKKIVTVNNTIVTKSDYHISTEEDVVKVNDDVIQYEPFVYIMMNKPPGVVSSTDDKDTTVIDIIEGYDHYDLHPVGRLDKDTEGLLILTNDGQFSHEVLSPKKHVNKTYYAEIDGIVDEETIKLFEEGVTLDDGYVTMPAKLMIIESGPISLVEITIQEGKFHQVKRMFQSCGTTVTYLKRIQMGQLMLDETLDKGEYRKLNAEEIALAKINKL